MNLRLFQEKRIHGRERRIRDSVEFRRLQRQGTRIHGKALSIIYVKRAPDSTSRLGLIVSKKVDKRAVKRNKIKRRIREIFRFHFNRLREPVDIIVLAKREAITRPYEALEEEYLRLLERKSLLSKG